MPRRIPRFALTLSLALFGASAATADQPAEPADYARPVNRCQIAGQHVSGVVSVDLGDGRHAELTLVDVGAIVAMAPALSDVQVYVNAPVSFSGRFVPRDLGGPAAYLARAYRSPDRGLQLAPSVPFEITLGSDPSMASVRLPSPFGDGVLLVSVPCAELRAGAPRANTRPRPVEARPRLLTLLPGTRILSQPGTSGTELARVERTSGAQQPVEFVGRVGAVRNGFVRVSVSVGPARVSGFVPEGSVSSLGVGLGPAAYAGEHLLQIETLNGMARVRLPVGTPIFASPTAARGWASVTAPLHVFLRTRRAGERAAITLGPELFDNHPCRYDGVAGRLSCGDARAVPKLSLRSCTGSTCTDVAFVNPP